MRIIIHPADGEGPNAVDVEMQKAFEVLRSAHIQVSGGGVLGLDGNAVGAIVLREDAEAPKALETLAAAGIKAST